MNMQQEPQTILLTGGSSGLGLHTARQLRQAGFRVIAGARSFQEGKTAEGIITLPLDVTSLASVKAFAEKALAMTETIHAVVHCAGILVLGSCEETSPEEYRMVMETNFLGMVRVNQALLPALRKQGQGRIVLFSSINGLLGIPYQSAYTASKHAIEGYAECLQLELQDFGIQVCLVEPGDHRSGSEQYRHHAAALEKTSPYWNDYLSATAVIHRDEQHGCDPDRLGKKLASALKRKHLPFRLRIASADQHLAVYLHKLMPPGINQWILRHYYLSKKSETGDKHGEN